MQRQAVLYFGRATAVTSLESRNISDGYMGKVNWLQFRDHGTIYIGKDLQESNLQSSGEAKMCIFSDCREYFSRFGWASAHWLGRSHVCLWGCVVGSAARQG